MDSRLGFDRIRLGFDRIPLGFDRIRLGFDRIRLGFDRIRIHTLKGRRRLRPQSQQNAENGKIFRTSKRI